MRSEAGSRANARVAIRGYQSEGHRRKLQSSMKRDLITTRIATLLFHQAGPIYLSDFRGASDGPTEIETGAGRSCGAGRGHVRDHPASLRGSDCEDDTGGRLDRSLQGRPPGRV